MRIRWTAEAFVMRRSGVRFSSRAPEPLTWEDWVAADTSVGFKTNTVVLRGEVYAACVLERASAGLRIGT